MSLHIFEGCLSGDCCRIGRVSWPSAAIACWLPGYTSTAGLRLKQLLCRFIDQRIGCNRETYSYYSAIKVLQLVMAMVKPVAVLLAYRPVVI